MVLGILLGWMGLAIVGFVLGALGFAVLYFLKRHYISFYFLMLAAGAAIWLVNEIPQMPDEYMSQKHEYVAYVKSSVVNDGGQRCVLRIDSIDSQSVAPYLCLAYVRGYDMRMPYVAEQDATIRFNTRFKALEEGDTTKKGTFNYDKYYLSQGMSAKAYVSASGISMVNKPNWLYRWANYVNRKMFDGIVFSPINDSSAAFLVASILGERSYLPYDQRESFRATGVAHVLALSGLHVGIIVSLISIALFPLRLTRRSSIIRNIVTMLLVWLYAFVTGMSPSVTRAAVMVSVLLLGYVIQRRVFTFNSLFLAAAVVLAIDPHSLMTAGFQMSFAAVASILLFMDILPLSLKRHPVKYYVCSAIMLPISAMLGTGVISAYYFGSFPLLFLFSNLIVGLIFPPLLMLGVICMLFAMMGIELLWAGWIIDFLNAVMQYCIDWLASLDASISVDKFTAWALVPYATALILLAYGLRLIVNDPDKKSRGVAMLIYTAGLIGITLLICIY